MVDALSAHRSNQPFDIGILPGTLGRRQDLVDPHRLETRPKILAIGPVAISQQKPWRRIPGKRVPDLLGRPRGRRVYQPNGGGRDEDSEEPATLNWFDELKARVPAGP